MDYLIPLLERVERVERCKRPSMWGIEKDREGAGCIFARNRGLWVSEHSRAFTIILPADRKFNDERKSLDENETTAMIILRLERSGDALPTTI